ncbi:MAG TPA: hypothetical protein ENI20_19525 [Bacteroides sp.]|nr:hypothetical protein [Bacteroides sp.]
MKKLLLFLLTLLTVHASATVITVSNNPDSPAEYDDLQTALNNIDPGDTIILSGSPTSYGNVTANRTLVLLGPGWNPQSGYKAQLGTLTINGASHNSVIRGIQIRSLTSGGSYDNVVITDCYFDYVYTDITLSDHNNWQIYGNRFEGDISLNADSDNTLIANNVFSKNSTRGTVQYANNSTLFLNNVIIDPYTSGLFSNCSGMFLANNIFIMTHSTKYSNPNNGCTGCSFNNNITYSTYSIDIPDIPGQSDFGGNNWNDANPRFVNFPNDATKFSSNHDYHLAGDSPGKASGTDGTDTGIYGRGYEFNIYGHTDLPRIYLMNIENPVVLVDSSLNIVVKSTTTK